ncbi:MAG: hypothetical protein WDZ50_08035 [Woeseia sp.]
MSTTDSLLLTARIVRVEREVRDQPTEDGWSLFATLELEQLLDTTAEQTEIAPADTE